jgi:RHS repeat-associated protein
MPSLFRAAPRLLVALLLVSLTVPLETLRPDPAAVAAAALRRTPDVVEDVPPATPGTYRSATEAASVPVTDITIDKPAGTTTNDVLLAMVSVRGAPVMTPPAGWTLVRADTNGTVMMQSLYQRVAGGSEPASYTFSFDREVAAAIGVVAAYSGVDTTAPVDVSGGQTNASSASVTAPSITTSVANTVVVGFFGTGNDATFTPPSGMTERADLLNVSAFKLAVELTEVGQASAGASGSKVASASKSAANVGQLVALRPSGTIAFRAVASSASAPLAELTIDTPSGTAADDVLLAGVNVRSDATISAPAGWTQVRSDVSGTALRQTIFVRTAGASEPADYTFTFSGPVVAATGGIIAFDGMDMVTPVDASGGQANAASSSVTAPSISTTVADTTLVGFYATADDATFTAPSGMTERFDVLAEGTSDTSSASATVSVVGTGATGTKVATASKSAVNIGALVALGPEGATANLGVGPQHTFESWDLGAGDTLAANVATRNIVVGHPIVALPIRGSTVSIDATYNAKDAENVGLGPGWRLDVFRRLRHNGDGTVTFTDGSGARHKFTGPDTDGDITTYTRPATIYAELELDTGPSPDRFTLTYRDNSVDEFALTGGDGLLVRAEDRHGNGVDLAYTGGTTNLVTITDTAASPDRTIDLAWDTGASPDRLTTITDWAYVSGGLVQPDATGSRRAHRFFYDGSGVLAGWADPVDTSGSCPTAASHRTCLAYSGGRLSAISKTQTVTTESSGTLGTSTRTITTEIAYSGSDVTSVTDAQEQAQGTPERTTFTAESSTVLRVDRPTTTTSYGQVGAADPYGRIASVWRKLDGSTSIETRTTWDATYPIEPASVTDNYGALLSTPARTTSYSYVASSLGLVSKIVEPLTATDERWTEFSYNATNDETSRTVSAEGDESVETGSVWAADECSPNAALVLLCSTIENVVDGDHGGTAGHVEDVTTDYEYDAYGQRIRETRHNYAAGSGTPLDERVDAFSFDDRGNLTAEIANHDDGDVTAGTSDTDPAPGEARTDLTTTHEYDTAGNRISTADPRRAIALAVETEAYDPFERSVSDGWGTADTGGSWSGTDATFDVASGTGTISLGSNTNRNAYLSSTSLRDQEVLVRVRVDRLAVGSDHFIWLYLRRQDGSNYYQARLTFTTTGKTVLSLREVDGGTTTVLDAATTSAPHATTDWYWLRVRLSGSSTLEAKGRLWKDGTTEPGDWTVEATDASPPAALQNAGDLGVRFQLGGSYSGSYPVVASFDDLVLTDLGGGGEAIGADDYVTRTSFDALDQAVSSESPTTPGLAGASTTTTTTFDELGAVRRSVDTADLVTATVYDRAGRATTVYEDPDPAGSAYVIAEHDHDADGRVVGARDRRQAADADLGQTTTDYDALGRPVAVISADGSSPDVAAETRTTIDALDRVTATEVGYGSASSQLTELTLDLGGRATETDDGFACTTTTFDHRDLPMLVTDALDAGTCAANADSREVTNSYDGLGRLTGAEVTDGPDDGDRPMIATFDAAGNTRSSAVEVASVTTTSEFEHDVLDQVTTETREDGSAAKTTYDPVGNPVDRCSWAAGASVGDCLAVGSAGWTNPPTSSTSTRWDARNGRIGLTDSAANQTTVYDPDEGYQVSAIYIPTDVDQTREHQSLYAYDSRQRLESITHRLCTISAGHSCSSTSATGSVSYEYDQSDNRSRVTEDNGSASTDFRYCHDARNQLTGRGSTASCTTSNVESFVFDDAGNRTQAVEGGVTRNFAYTVAGLLCDVETGSAASCTSGNIASDDAGRISDAGDWHYQYDAQGRLVAACDDDDCAGSGFDRLDFSYDGEGHRTAILETPASGSPVETTFRYAGDAIVAEYRDGTRVREYVTDEAGTIRKVIVPVGVTGAGTYLVTWNGHGDAMALYRIESNGSLTLANSYTYGTWGTPTTATHNSIPDLGFRFLYVGAWDVQWDDAFGLGLLYMHARHYSPALGRFLQPDPSRLDEQLFVYAGSGPVSKVDPDGHEWIVLSRSIGKPRPLTRSYESRRLKYSLSLLIPRAFDAELSWSGFTNVVGPPRHQYRVLDTYNYLRVSPLQCLLAT